MTWTREVFFTIDCETTGLDTWEDLVIEVAVVLFDGGQAVEHYAAFVGHDGLQIPGEITKLTGISQEEYDKSARPLREVAERVHALLQRQPAAPVVGYNVAYDRQIWANTLLRSGLALRASMLMEREWVCTADLARALTSAGRYDADYRLVDVARRLRVDSEGPEHRAHRDALVAGLCAVRMGEVTGARFPTTVADARARIADWRRSAPKFSDRPRRR